MRTTIRMDPELARRMKEYAARMGKTFTEAIEVAVMEHLARHGRDAAASRRKFKLPISKARGRPLTHEQIKAAIDASELDYDLKKAGLLGK